MAVPAAAIGGALAVLLAVLLALAGPGAAQGADADTTVRAVEDDCPEGDAFCFRPPAVTVAGGGPASLTLDNRGTMGHSLCIEGLPGGEACTANPSQGTPPGSTDAVQFQAPAGGTFAYYCAVPGHRDMGMEGLLTVRGGGAGGGPAPSSNGTGPPAGEPPGRTGATGDDTGGAATPGFEAAAAVAALGVLALAAGRRRLHP